MHIQNKMANITAQDIESWIREINESEMPIIVEGYNDRKALRNSGVMNTIIIANTRPVYKTIEMISANFKECIILTDNDKQGRKLYSKYNSELCQRGVRVDRKFREFFLKTRLNQLEGLHNHLLRLVGV